MDIRHRKEIRRFAAERLEGREEGKKIVLIYTGLALGLALLTTAVNYILNLQIGNTGGLSNMGTRAVLDTLIQVLPMVQSVILICLDLGYCAAMLRIARGQYVSHRTLKLGFDRFWPLLRLSLLRGGIFLAAGVASVYLGTMIYLLTPLSDPAMEILTPLMANTSVLNPSILLDDSLYSQLLGAMAPCFLICGIAALVLVLPLWYRYRLASYVLIDKPAFGALMALRESRILMHKNRWNFFRLDLSLWFYPAVLILVGMIAYGDVLLPLMGVELGDSREVAFFGFYVLSLLLQGGVYYLLRNRVEVSYCLAYDSLLPKENPDNAVVLGNIFKM